MVIDEMITLFLDSRRRGQSGARKVCRPKTLQYYEYHLQHFSDFLLQLDGGAVTQYGSIRRTHLIKLQDWVQSKVKAGDWSEATEVQFYGSLRTFFRWVEQDEDCQTEQLKSYAKWLPPIKATPKRLNLPEVPDIKVFRNRFNTQDKWEYRDYVICSLMIDTGLRAGEVSNLRVDHTKLESQILLVTGKTGPRAVNMTSDMSKLLRGWVRKRDTLAQAKDSPYMFVSKRKPQLDVNSIGQAFRKHCKRHGIKNISAHGFRHSYATNYLRQGGNMENLRINMGHSNYEMLRKYLDLARQGSKEALAELEKVSLLKETIRNGRK